MTHNNPPAELNLESNNYKKKKYIYIAKQAKVKRSEPVLKYFEENMPPSPSSQHVKQG